MRVSHEAERKGDENGEEKRRCYSQIPIGFQAKHIAQNDRRRVADNNQIGDAATKYEKTTDTKAADRLYMYLLSNEVVTL